MAEPAFRHPIGPWDHIASEGRLYPSLHLLRVLAALSIFAGHWSEPYVAQLWPQGQIAIDVFFMIEGFLAMRLLGKRDGKTGLVAVIRHRVVHVYATYMIGLLAGFYAFAPFALGKSEGWTVANWHAALLSGALLLPTFSTLVHGSVFPLNPPSWAIVLELIGFVLLAAIRHQHVRSALLVVWIAALATFAALAISWHDPNAGWSTLHYWGGFPRMIIGFLGGAILYPLHGRIDRFMPKLAPVWLGVAFFAMHLPTIRFSGWALLAIGVPALVSLAASARRPAWSRATGAWAARNALMIYVLGYPIMMILRVASPKHPLPMSGLHIGLNFVVALGSLLIVATAINRLYTRLSNQRRSGGSAHSAG